MLIRFDNDRASDSPFIERVWSCHSTLAGTFVSVASCHWELVISRLEGQSIVTVRGPAVLHSVQINDLGKPAMKVYVCNQRA